MVTLALVTELTDEETLKKYGLKKEGKLYVVVSDDGSVLDIELSLEAANAHANQIHKKRLQKDFSNKKTAESKWDKDSTITPK